LGTDLDGETSAADANVGAHQAHLTTPSNYTADIACNDCHIKPTAVGDAGHFDTDRPAELTFSAFANNIGNLVSAYNPATGACSNTYCHGNLMPAGSSPGVGNTPIWNDITYLSGTPTLAGDCSQCHNAPPVELAAYHNAGLTFSDCDTCHQHLNDDGTFANALLHMDGIVQALACEACHGQPPFNAATMIN
jgi:predicted CxxxxCH...CXXCH cytochrome family protein